MMKKIFVFYSLLLIAGNVFAQNCADGFRNPVIGGFHPDPSVCRVGNDYYLVNSSFQYFPGVPIYHSKDLVNWEQIGNVLDRESQLPLGGASSWLGIYAPTIRFYEGTYYMITTNVGNGGNFFVTAKDPRGPWSEPVWLKQGGIDPSLYFEKDTCYMVSNPDDGIWLCQIDPLTGTQLTESKLLWQGDGGRYPEGPHLYKKDGWYYLLISEGGTELAHRLTIARSRKIEGPYEGYLANPILTNCCRLGQSKQIQGTGHGDLVQAEDGSWWMVFLAYRSFGGSYHHLGRETCLAPVEWEKGGWPVVNGNGTVDTMVICKTLPLQPFQETRRRGSFADGKLGPEWVYIQNPSQVAEVCRTAVANGKESTVLRLHASEGSLDDNQQPSFIGIRQEDVAFSLETCLAAVSDSVEKTGLTVYQINDGHADLFVRKDNAGYSIALRYRVKSIDTVVKEIKLDTVPTDVCLRVVSDGNSYRFYYRKQASGIEWHELGSIDCPLLSTEVVGGFTGMMLGLFSQGAGCVDFRYFDYQKH